MKPPTSQRRAPQQTHHEQTQITSPGVIPFDIDEATGADEFPTGPVSPPPDLQAREVPARGAQAPQLAGARRGVPQGRPMKPFTFKNLPKVTRAQAMLMDRLEFLLPTAGADRDTVRALCQRLKELFEDEVTIVLDHLHVVRPDELRRIAAEPTFLAVLAPSPQRPRALLEIDLSLCHASIDKLLGGTGDAIASRPLTDIEEGVMGFIILECLKTLAPNLDAGLPKPRLEGSCDGIDEAVELLGREGQEEQVAVVQLKATLGNQAGFVRLFLPSSVVGMTNGPVAGPERRARRTVQIERSLPRLKAVKSWLRAEIGRAGISTRDLSGMGPGDVVLLDELTARPDKGEGGVVRLRVGNGRIGRLLAELIVEDNHYKARITGFESGEEAQHAAQPGEPDGAAPGTEDAAGGAVSENEQGEASDLLADIPLQLAVEIARVPVTAEAVVGLKTGQVIDLNKMPGEPVEMSVNGKVIARGELVDIEGQLGVKILSLVG